LVDKQLKKALPIFFFILISKFVYAEGADNGFVLLRRETFDVVSPPADKRWDPDLYPLYLFRYRGPAAASISPGEGE
jgi:hypothetical protein